MSNSMVQLVVALVVAIVLLVVVRIAHARGRLPHPRRLLARRPAKQAASDAAPAAPAERDVSAPPATVVAARGRVVLQRPRATRHPIMLAHGWFGFDRIGVPRFEHDYFRGIPHRLAQLGHRVHVARVSPTGSVSMRAAQLARQIEQLGDARVNIIAHSMGGLDARLAIARLGLGDRVASLTTIGTPHHGTPLADMAADFGEWRRLRRLLATAGVDVDGLYDISTTKMREFNQLVADSPQVAYASVVGVIDPQVRALNMVLSLGHGYLLSRSGPNDGLVPAWSQRWGDSVLEVAADHWAQVGWFGGGFDALGFYAQLAERLADRGL